MQWRFVNRAIDAVERGEVSSFLHEGPSQFLEGYVLPDGKGVEGGGTPAAVPALSEVLEPCEREGLLRGPTHRRRHMRPTRSKVPGVLLVCRNSTDANYFQRLRPYPRVLLGRKCALFKDYDKS